MTSYKIKKEEARMRVIALQNDIQCLSLSYGELVQIQDYLEAIGKRYGLLREFRENGVI